MNLNPTIIGQDPYKDKLRKKAEELDPNSVEFKSFLPRQKYLETLVNAKYAINLNSKEAYSIFVAEALAIGTPAIVSREIAENLEAETKSFHGDLVVAEEATIKTWSEVVKLYLEELYCVKS